MAFNVLAPQVAARLAQDLQLTPEQAAGIVGQLGYESAGLQAINERNPVVPGSRGGFGWAQWTGPRRRQFETFAAQNGLDITDPEANYRFLVHELTNTPEGRVLPAIRQAKDAQTAGRIFTDQFLRPGVPAYDRRASWTERALNLIIPTAQAGTLTQGQSRPPKAWKDVIASKEYQALSPEQKVEAQNQYFNEVVAPRVPSGEVEAARAQFFTQYPVDYMRIEISHEESQEKAGPTSSLAPNGQPWLPLGRTNVHPEQTAEEEKPSVLRNLARGVAQGAGDMPAGIAQNAVHEALAIVNAIAPGSSIAQRVQERVAQIDKEAEDREQEYQAATPESVAAGIGRLIGGTAIPGGVGSRLVTVGGNLGRSAAAALTNSAGAQTAGRALGQIAGSSTLGAGLATTQPVDESGDFGAIRRGQALMGGVAGGALPAAGAVARGVVGNVSPEVARLAQRAQELGINIRPDQLLNSKPVNALAAALDYLPFSGRQGALSKQQKQFNLAVAKTIGEDTPNLTVAINNASRRLGAQFDKYLKNTAIKADDQFRSDLSRVMQEAREEMTDQQFSIISRQVDNILAKAKNGALEGTSAYNLKKILDRIGKSSDSTVSYYGKQLRSVLLDALNRSLPDGGKEFAKVRQQWSNLRELEKLVPRGAEGSVSAARLANAKGIKGGELNDLANIAAQFLKPRVGDSGTAQRAGIYAGLFGPGIMYDPMSVGIGLGVGRLANTVMGNPLLANSMIRGVVRPLGLNGNAAPVSGHQALPATVRGLFPDLLPGLASGSAGLAVTR